jgi:hypothetical protein
LQSGFSPFDRFLVVELTHLSLNFRFDMRVIFMANYFLENVMFLSTTRHS